MVVQFSINDGMDSAIIVAEGLLATRTKSIDF